MSGDLGRHTMAIMAVRENLSFDAIIESDCAPLVEPVNEGRFVAFVPPAGAERAVDHLRRDPRCAGARIVGSINASRPGLVTMKSLIGATGIVDLLSGEQLPRIC